jgi:hypothetical protein
MGKYYAVTTVILVFIFSVAGFRYEGLWAQVIWDSSIEVAPSTFGNTRPRIAADANGNPLIIWGKSTDLWFTKWNGTSFETPVKLNPSGITVAVATWMGPEIAAHGDTVYVVYKQTPEEDDNSHIWCRRSFDGGVTWLDPVQVENIGEDKSRFASITTDDAGHPIVAFMRFHAGFHDPRWVVCRSFDHGNTFTPDVMASGWSGPQSEVCDCCPASIDCEGNMVTLVYRDNNENLRDSWAAISEDGGITFSKGVNIDQNEWMIGACPASGPDGAIANGVLYSTFMNGASGSSIVFFNNTSLEDPSSVSSTAVSGAGQGLQQNFPRIAAHHDAGAMLWRHSANFSTGLALMFTEDLTQGWPSSFDTLAFSNVANGDVILTHNKVLVAWQGNSPSVVNFRSGQYNTSTGTAGDLLTPPFTVFPNPATDWIFLNREDGWIRIANLTGQIVLTGTGNKVDVGTLPPGLYFITTPHGSARWVKL